MYTGETAQSIGGKVTQIVDTIPYWVHDITNIEMTRVVMFK